MFDAHGLKPPGIYDRMKGPQAGGSVWLSIMGCGWAAKRPADNGLCRKDRKIGMFSLSFKTAVFGGVAGVLLAVCAQASSHREIEGPFPDGPSVTRTCLGCHEEAASEVMQTAHWQWKGPNPYLEGEAKEPLGKANLINNF